MLNEGTPPRLQIYGYFFEIKFKIKESARYGRADSFLWGVYREFIAAIVSTTSYSSSKLYSSYDEVFGVTPLITFKVSVDFAEVGLAVLRGRVFKINIITKIRKTSIYCRL